MPTPKQQAAIQEAATIGGFGAVETMKSYMVSRATYDMAAEGLLFREIRTGIEFIYCEAQAAFWVCGFWRPGCYQSIKF